MTVTQFGVLIEGFESKLRVLIEGFENKLNVVADGVIGLRDRVDCLEKKFDGLEKKFDSLEKKVDSLEKKVDDVRANQAMTLQRLTMLEIHARKTDQRLDVMDQRLKKVETTTAQILKDTTAIKTIIGNHDVCITRLETFSPS